MREIKFRAWDEETGCMVFFGLGEDKFSVVSPKDGNHYHLYLENVTAIMQYTGLTDKNGKETYEGDICVSPLGEKGVVKFVNSGFWIEYLPPYDWDIMCPGEPISDELEVIGNIYEDNQPSVQ